MVNKNNAEEGKETELMIKNNICDWSQIINILKEKFKIKGKLDNTSRSGIYGDKADVRISFDCGHYIDVNVKGYKIGFNQLVRTSISQFCRDFNLSESDKLDLERIIREKAKNTKRELFTEKDWVKWSVFFENNVEKLLKLAFSENPNREILVLYNKETFVVKIYSMKDVLRELSKQKIKRTKGGFNLGKNISFQRKGGDGNIKTYPKTDLRHPSNNIQMKLKIGKDKDFLNSIELAKYNIQ
jgi:hypothetical protein